MLIVLFFLLVLNLQGQTLSGDTTQVINAAEEEELHSPKKASMYSAILPGLGQVYNKKAWKVPFIYVGFGAIAYFIDWNNDNYKLNRTAYLHLVDEDPNTQSHLDIEAIQYYDLDNSTSFNNFKDGLIKRQDYYRRNRDLLIISMAAFWGLNIIDASVDAHLFNFDISDDLTFNWQPSMLNLNSQYVYCVNCTISF